MGLCIYSAQVGLRCSPQQMLLAASRSTVSVEADRLRSSLLPTLGHMTILDTKLGTLKHAHCSVDLIVGDTHFTPINSTAFPSWAHSFFICTMEIMKCSLCVERGSEISSFTAGTILPQHHLPAGTLLRAGQCVHLSFIPCTNPVPHGTIVGRSPAVFPEGLLKPCPSPAPA